MTDTLEIKLIPLDDAVSHLWDRNPKSHDLGALCQSIERHGFKDLPKWEKALNNGAGGVVAGNGRIQALVALQAQGRPAPRGIVERDGVWFVPVLFGVDADSQAAAESFGLDSNNLGLMGGDFTAVDMMRLWEPEAYTSLLQDLAAMEMLPVSVDGDDLDTLLHLSDAPNVEFKEYDESVANEVKYCECPNCGHKFPK